MFVRMVNSCLIINMKQIFLFYAENVLKMRKMRKSANYADPHHRILSDALHIARTVFPEYKAVFYMFDFTSFFQSSDQVFSFYPIDLFHLDVLLPYYLQTM